jgi:hypothetical protein
MEQRHGSVVEERKVSYKQLRYLCAQMEKIRTELGTYTLGVDRRIKNQIYESIL